MKTTILNMQKKIMRDLAAIHKTAKSTGMSGKVVLKYSGVTVTEWDQVIEGIKEYKRIQHFVEVTPETMVVLTLD